MFYFRHLIEYVFTKSLLYLKNVYDYDFVYVLLFGSHINLDQWYHSNLLFDCFSVHAPDEVQV